jgi:hypothetical protein
MCGVCTYCICYTMTAMLMRNSGKDINSLSLVIYSVLASSTMYTKKRRIALYCTRNYNGTVEIFSSAAGHKPQEVTPIHSAPHNIETTR